jgi:hypothetical protein
MFLFGLQTYMTNTLFTASRNFITYESRPGGGGEGPLSDKIIPLHLGLSL